MNVKTSVLALALGLALGGAATAASMSSADAADVLVRTGFSDVSPLDYRNEQWVGMARNGNGDLVQVSVDPISSEVTWTRDGKRTVTRTTTTTTTRGPTQIALADRPVVVEEVVGPPVVRVPVVVEDRVLVPVGERIGKSDVRRVLVAAGYHDIHDIDWSRRHGIWTARARDPAGDKLEIHVDPADGRILRVEDD